MTPAPTEDLAEEHVRCDKLDDYCTCNGLETLHIESA